MGLLEEILMQLRNQQTSGLDPNNQNINLMALLGQSNTGITPQLPPPVDPLIGGLPLDPIGYQPQPQVGFNFLKPLPTNFSGILSPNNGSGQPLDLPLLQSGQGNLNALDYQQNNQSLVNNFDEFMALANAKVGNDSSNQIQSIIDDLKAQQQMIPKDVSFGTKLASVALSALSGDTGAGLQYLEGQRQRLQSKKELLSQQEIQARTLKYQSDLQKENTLRGNYAEIYQRANNIASTKAVNAMDYNQKVMLSKLDMDIRMRINGSEQLQRLELEAVKNGNQKELLKSEALKDLTKQYGPYAAQIWEALQSGQPFSPDVKAIVDKYSMGSLEDRRLKVAEGQLASQQAEQNGVVSTLKPGSLANVYDAVELEKDAQAMQFNPYFKGYQANKAKAAAVTTANGKLVSSRLTPELNNKLNEVADNNNIPREVFFGLVQQESGNFDLSLVAQPNKAFKPEDGRNAVGLTQITRDTAKTYKLDYERLKTDPAYALEAGAKIFGDILKKNDGDITKALIAYNSGSNKKIISYDPKTLTHTYTTGNGVKTERLSAQTQEYIAKILGTVDGYRTTVGVDQNDQRNRVALIRQKDSVIDRTIQNFRDSNSVEVIDPTTGQPQVDPITSKPIMRRPTEEEVLRQKKTLIESEFGTDPILADSKELQDRLRNVQQLLGEIPGDNELRTSLAQQIQLQVMRGDSIQDIRATFLDDPKYSDDLRKFGDTQILIEMEKLKQEKGSFNFDFMGRKINTTPNAKPTTSSNVPVSVNNGLGITQPNNPTPLQQYNQQQKQQVKNVNSNSFLNQFLPNFRMF